jgi:uncharacterized protein YutE (UPF0331/DUF86 family)
MMSSERGTIEHLAELEDSLEDWKRYQKVTLEELRTDRDKRNMVLHAMLVSIQSSIDIANHLIVQEKLRKPSTYREAFDILAEGKVIPLKLADELSELAGFRNMLVHIYWRIDIKMVCHILHESLNALEEFADIVKKMLR